MLKNKLGYLRLLLYIYILTNLKLQFIKHFKEDKLIFECALL